MSNKAFDALLSGSNIEFIESLYAQYLENPAKVEPSWAELFAPMGREGVPLVCVDHSAFQNPKTHATANTPPSALQTKFNAAAEALRCFGHFEVDLDPLGLWKTPNPGVAELALAKPNQFSTAELESEVFLGPTPLKLKDALAHLRHIWANRIGFEFSHMRNTERRQWLQTRVEQTEASFKPTREQQLHMLEKLSMAEAFETTAHTKFQAVKRFSIEGADTLVPMLDAALSLGATLGVREAVFGMTHRGRLNVLTNIIQKSAEDIYNEFAGPSTNPEAFFHTGDVKYHLGASNNVRFGDETLHLTLCYNPSHLGFVHPVVEGRVRAKQQRLGENGLKAVLPVVVNGDGAFSAQGLVIETLNLSELQHYATGGTLHLVVNNQLGYTTQAPQGRSSPYCTDVARAVDVPVFHVNGDDVEACVYAAQLAIEYRQRFGGDVVIDLVCYRKYGHNEGDEPAFTQPKMYQLIRQHPSPRALYAQNLLQQGRISQEEADTLLAKANAHFAQAYANSKANPKLPAIPSEGGIWKNYCAPWTLKPRVPTRIQQEQLTSWLNALASLPQGFVPHPGIARLLERRKKMALGQENLDWGAAEMLAYASLLAQGHSIRLTGQDTERGTFAHRQAVVHCTATGAQHHSLSPIAGPTPFVLSNSPLSEAGCLGFEYGYSLDAPDELVIWETQFGDFANCAQVFIDQFICSGEDKWKRMTGIVLILPHGYEGAGPEHSSGRIERFLTLAAENNIRICVPSNAAQMFHLLREQFLLPWRKPLMLISPKSLLRLADATSPMSDFTSGSFQKILPESDNNIPLAQADRLILCYGKVYFELAKTRQTTQDTHVAIVRMEQLYPLDKEALYEVLRTMPQLKEVLWVQEEPQNMGAWHYMYEILLEALAHIGSKAKLRYVGREASASPSTGYMQTHELEQKLLSQEALKRGNHAR
ncbi:MAG: 2-oxoglutarate dehydrogenase E1 component [Proteobacteria bacterium]|nr:2-oxoglutarate dehydrogenase E1 component [Cystobacterineae bacterium]MCL2259562.1 2-oxoglutarate dehydrogenase E1 component [Cystobacterineae bacterium]MCL2313973.1 2-oxoglutarate dehydrogenase E1 component [Pseudomonadota bacterium]